LDIDNFDIVLYILFVIFQNVLSVLLDKQGFWDVLVKTNTDTQGISLLL